MISPAPALRNGARGWGSGRTRCHSWPTPRPLVHTFVRMPASGHVPPSLPSMQLSTVLTLLSEVLYTKTCPMPNPRAHAPPGAHSVPSHSASRRPPPVRGESRLRRHISRESRAVHAGLVPTFPAHSPLILNHLYELLVMDLEEGGEEV